MDKKKQRRKGIKKEKQNEKKKSKERQKCLEGENTEKKESQWEMNTESKTCTFQHA